MPQARLPDINTAFIVYRREAISSWKSQTYDSCFGSLQTLNGLLPEDYRVKISDKDYYAKVNLDVLYACKACQENTPLSKITIKDIILPLMANIVSGAERDRVWDCPKCNVTNRVETTLMTRQVLQEPYFLSVIPKPPLRKEGMQDRSRYHSKFSVWFWQAMGEIENRMAQFRDDNWHKSGEEYDFEENLEDSGESED